MVIDDGAIVSGLICSSVLYFTYATTINYFCINKIIKEYKQQLIVSIHHKVINGEDFSNYMKNIRSKFISSLFLIFKDMEVSELFHDRLLYNESVDNINLSIDRHNKQLEEKVKNEKDSGS